jgi:hypothetical protein
MRRGINRTNSRRGGNVSSKKEGFTAAKENSDCYLGFLLSFDVGIEKIKIMLILLYASIFII